MATTLNLVSTFSFTDPNSSSPSVTPERGLQGDGIAYNPNTNNLFVVRTDAPSGPASRVQSILEFRADGTYVDEFDLGEIGQTAVGGTVLPNGNLLVVALNPGPNQTFATRLIEVATDGTVPTNGINLALPAQFNDRTQRGLVVGVTYSPGYTTNSRLRSKEDTILVITSRSQEIVEFDLEGNIVSSVDLSQYGVTAPQGLAINPATGNIFVADEATTSGGTNKIYEISPLRDELAVATTNTRIPRLGSLVSIIDTAQEFGFTDPEGLSFNADGTALYVVFDGDDPAPTTRITLDEAFTFDFADGEGLAFRASDNTLFVLQSSTTNGPVWNVFQYDTNGTQVGTEFTVNLGAFAPQDITVRSDNGNLILSGLDLSTFQQRFVEIDPTNQVKATTGIDFSFAFSSTSDVFSGVFYNPDTATLFGADYLGKSVVEFDPTTGTIKTTNGVEHRWTVGSLIASRTFSPQAITYDATTGHYLLAGDVDSGNLIYEVGLEFNSSGSPTATLYGVTNTESALGIQDAEGLAIDPNTRTLYASFDNDRFNVQTFGSVTVNGIGGKVARAALSNNTINEVAEFTLQSSQGLLTLKTIDKFGVAGEAITLTVEDFTTIPSQNFAPTVPAFSGTTLAGITILGLPGAGTLTLNGSAVSVGDVITTDQISSLSYTANTDFSGVDTFQVSASDGTASSAPAHIDLFVSDPDASKLIAIDTFAYDIGNSGDIRFNNSADGIVYNPTTDKVYTSSSFRINPTDPNTIGWRLIESNTDGSDPRVILQSEAPALTVDGHTPFTPLDGVPVLDLVPEAAGIHTDGIQDLAVVQGTGTSRDGNILILSTRGALIREITPTGEAVDGGINIDGPGLLEAGAAFDRSAVGLLHRVENGQEYVYVTDFGERLIRQIPALKADFDTPFTVTPAFVVSEIELQTTFPEARLQAITYDSVTGNFFVADDASGNTAIYEITPEGEVVGFTDMLALGTQLGTEKGLTGTELTAFIDKFADIEGISIDPVTRVLYAAIDDDGVGQFGLQNIGGQVVAIQLSNPGNPVIEEDSYEFTVDITAEDGDNVGEPIAASDPDDDDTVTYSITAGNEDPDGDGNKAFVIIDTSVGQISVNDADDLALVDVFNLTVTATDSKGLTDTTDVEITVDGDLQESPDTVGIFTINSTQFANFLIQSVTQVNNFSLGIFFTDDANGTIEGLSPDDGDYASKALARSLSLLSALGGGNNDKLPPGQLKKVLGLKNAASLVSTQQSSNIFFGLIGLESGSISRSTELSSLILSTSEGFNTTVNNDGSISITLSGQTFTLNSTDNLEGISPYAPQLPLVVGDDNELVDAVIADFSILAINSTVQVNASVSREAAYDNVLGFFAVNANGDVITRTGNTVAFGNNDTYRQAIRDNLLEGGNNLAVNNDVSNQAFNFSVNINNVLNGFYILPVLAVQGNFNTASAIYYPILGINNDPFDRMASFGANQNTGALIFGFEDLPNGGDRDFDDFVVEVTFS